MGKSQVGCAFATRPLACRRKHAVQLCQIILVASRHDIPVEDHHFISGRVVDGGQEVGRIGDLD